METLKEHTEALRREPLGHEFAKYCWLLARHAGRGGLPGAADESQRFDMTAPNVRRVLMAAVAAGDTTTAGWASELAAYRGLTREYIQIVARLSVLGKLNYVRVPFLTRTINETTHFSAGWVAQGQPIPLSRATLSAAAMLQEKKVATITCFTSELFDAWSPAVAQNFLNAITAALVFASDASLLDPIYAETAQQPASLTNGIAPGQSTGATAAQITADLKALLANFSDFSRVIIAMAPQSALHLSQLLTTGGVNAFPDMKVTGGSIWGVPVAVTTAAALVGSPQSNFIVAIDGAKILVADDGVVTAEGSTASSLQFTDVPSGGAASLVSLFQSSTRALRLLRYLNYERTHASAVSWFSTAGY